MSLQKLLNENSFLNLYFDIVDDKLLCKKQLIRSKYLAIYNNLKNLNLTIDERILFENVLMKYYI